jgi:tight adherence protein B
VNAAVPALLAAAAYVTFTARPRLLATPAPTTAALPLVAVAAAGYLAGPAVALLTGAALLAYPRARRRLTAAREARTVRDAVPEVCRAVAAELRSGAPPDTALLRAAADAPPALARHLRRLAPHPPPPPAWAGPPGTERLVAVGALWWVAADAGAGLADGLDRLAGALVAEQRQRAEVAAQLAGPKASAAVLAALPAFGIALAAALGARPLHFFGRTPLGAACLLAGAGLDAAGVLWVRRLAAGAAP